MKCALREKCSDFLSKCWKCSFSASWRTQKPGAVWRNETKLHPRAHQGDPHEGERRGGQLAALLPPHQTDGRHAWCTLSTVAVIHLVFNLTYFNEHEGKPDCLLLDRLWRRSTCSVWAPSSRPTPWKWSFQRWCQRSLPPSFPRSWQAWWGRSYSTPNDDTSTDVATLWRHYCCDWIIPSILTGFFAPFDSTQLSKTLPNCLYGPLAL